MKGPAAKSESPGFRDHINFLLLDLGLLGCSYDSGSSTRRLVRGSSSATGAARFRLVSSFLARDRLAQRGLSAGARSSRPPSSRTVRGDGGSRELALAEDLHGTDTSDEAHASALPASPRRRRRRSSRLLTFTGWDYLRKCPMVIASAEVLPRSFPTALIGIWRPRAAGSVRSAPTWTLIPRPSSAPCRAHPRRSAAVLAGCAGYRGWKVQVVAHVTWPRRSRDG